MPDFLRSVKDIGYLVKLDTNGSNPNVLLDLKTEGLIDYVAMDVKGPRELYSNLAGRKVNQEDVERSIGIASQFPGYEFRTTVVPVVRGEEDISWMTVEEAVDAAKWIVEVTGSDAHRYFLQPFVPREDGLIDSRFEEFPGTSKELLEEMCDAVKKHLPRCEIR